jgi:hypothetical protein
MKYGIRERPPNVGHGNILFVLCAKSSMREIKVDIGRTVFHPFFYTCMMPTRRDATVNRATVL